VFGGVGGAGTVVPFVLAGGLQPEINETKKRKKETETRDLKMKPKEKEREEGSGIFD